MTYVAAKVQTNHLPLPLAVSEKPVAYICAVEVLKAEDQGGTFQKMLNLIPTA
jgi:hypothetical protein